MERTYSKKRVFISFDKSFLISRIENQNQVKIQIVNQENQEKYETEWNSNDTPTSLINDIIMAYPRIKEHLPIVEITSQYIQYKRRIVYGAYLLSSGHIVKQYVPIIDLIKELSLIMKRKDSFAISDGEHAYNPSYSEIVMLFEI